MHAPIALAHNEKLIFEIGRGTHFELSTEYIVGGRRVYSSIELGQARSCEQEAIYISGMLSITALFDQNKHLTAQCDCIRL